MDLTGLVDKIIVATADIDKGRRFFTIDGSEHLGRLHYEAGISRAFDTFKSGQSTRDPYTMILIELTYLQQDLHFCDDADTKARASLTKAIQSFEDSLRTLAVAEDSALYRGAEATYPTDGKYRYYKLPRDAVHLACAAHRTRLDNSLRVTGINMDEKAVITQRSANTAAIQAAHLEKQKKALEPSR